MAASLRDVARAAGVSLATASRALNGTGGRSVSPENRASVLQAADQLEYQPTLSPQRQSGATSNSARRTNNVGLVLRAAYRYMDPFWNPVLEGVTAELLRQGYHIRFSFIVDDLAHDQRRRLLDARFVDGLILIGDIALASEIVGITLPDQIVVIAGFDSARWESDVRFDVITMEKHAAMDSLIGHLVGLGHRRFAFLGPGPDQDRRGEGFVHALARRGIPLVPRHYVECQFGTDEGYAAARALLLKHGGSLDAVVCACDTLAIGAMRAAKECGLHLPADLAIAGFDNIPFSRDLDPPLTTVQVPKELMGELAARRLVERINNPGWPPIIQMVPTSLVIRASGGEPTPD